MTPPDVFLNSGCVMEMMTVEMAVMKSPRSAVSDLAWYVVDLTKQVDITSRVFFTVGNFSSGFWFIAVQIACWDDTYSCNSNRERGETPYCIYVEWVCTQLYFAFHLKLKNEHMIIFKPPPGKVQMEVNTWDKAQLITTSIFWKCWAQSMVKSLLGVWRWTGLFRGRGWTRAVLWTTCYAGDRPPGRDHSPAVCTRRFPVSNKFIAAQNL